uniref:Uncharacterized protein n=1 Tax=Serinus canaria TaxID=9135 RepID=A0A8C9MQX9_SERCA
FPYWSSRYWLLSAAGSVMGLGGRGGRLWASSFSHCTSTSLYSSMAVWASSTDEWLLVLTWIFLWSRCLAKFLRETLALTGSPALFFSAGLWLVSRVLSFGWKYFRAWKSLWMACPTTILSFKIFRIWKSHRGKGRTDPTANPPPCGDGTGRRNGARPGGRGHGCTVAPSDTPRLCPSLPGPTPPHSRPQGPAHPLADPQPPAHPTTPPSARSVLPKALSAHYPGPLHLAPGPSSLPAPLPIRRPLPAVPAPVSTRCPLYPPGVPCAPRCPRC